jgi:hypothetical protein
MSCEYGKPVLRWTLTSCCHRVIFLRRAALFAGLPPQDLQLIAEVAEEHLFAEGHLIAAEGEPGETTYIGVSWWPLITAGSTTTRA